MTRVSRYIPYLLAALVALIPFGRLSELGLLALILLGLSAWRQLRLSPLAIAFAVIFIPMLFALMDAEHLSESAASTFGYLRFGALALALYVLLNHEQLVRSERLIAVIVVLWSIDAGVQVIFGRDLLGYAITEDRVNGVFGDGNLKLGATLAVLGAVVLEVAARRSLWAWMAAVALLSSVILLAGTRAAWLMWACVVGLYGWWLLGGKRRTRVLKITAIALAGVLLVGLSYTQSERFAQRVDRTAMILNGDRAALDSALAYRLEIWETAARMFAHNPLNGIGVRGFRYSYPAYADSTDRFISADRQTGAAHPHQLLLEFAAETGGLGVLGLLGFMAVLIKAWLRASSAARTRARPYAAALVAVAFPLNTHYAWFSSFWALLIWLTVALYCVALREE